MITAKDKSLGSGIGCYRTDRPTPEDGHFTQLPDRSFKVDMTRFIQVRLRSISLQRERRLDRRAEATEGEVKALRTVAAVEFDGDSLLNCSDMDL